MVMLCLSVPPLQIYRIYSSISPGLQQKSDIFGAATIQIMLIFEYACNSSQTFLVLRYNCFVPIINNYERLVYIFAVQNLIFKNDSSSVRFVLFLIRAALLSGLFQCNCPKEKFMLMVEYAYVLSQPLSELQNAYVRICFYSNKYGK